MKVYPHCISLARRNDRRHDLLECFPCNKVFQPIKFHTACDGKHLLPPRDFGGNSAAWGCYCSHIQLINYLYNEPILDKDEYFLILEDDAFPCTDFEKEFSKAMATVPTDWDFIFLGSYKVPSSCSNYYTQVHGPGIVTCKQFKGTHAYMIKHNVIRWYLKAYFQFCESVNPIDEELRIFIEEYGLSSYHLVPNLIGQRGGWSDIEKRCVSDLW
jgi:GR25 family glycosyltransferase involved in LPS biosynthesis